MAVKTWALFILLILPIMFSQLPSVSAGRPMPKNISPKTSGAEILRMIEPKPVVFYARTMQAANEVGPSTISAAVEAKSTTTTTSTTTGPTQEALKEWGLWGPGVLALITISCVGCVCYCCNSGNGSSQQPAAAAPANILRPLQADPAPPHILAINTGSVQFECCSTR